MPIIIRFSCPKFINISCPKSLKFDAFLREQENDEKWKKGKKENPKP